MTLDAARGLLTCPHCRQALELDRRVARCPDGHSFDVARQGYLNLLAGPEPANADTSDMVAARVRVQASGVFDALARALASATRGRRRVLEAGAGPATYLRACLGDDPGRVGIAVDVSRAAARVAARADARIASLVADVWRGLPVRDGCFDAVMSVFAPRNGAEFARALTPGGLLVVAVPSPAHLAATRARFGLLDIPGDKPELLRAGLPAVFEQVDSTRVTEPFTADPELVADLVSMGPNAFHTRVTPTRPLTDRVDVTVISLVRSRD